MGADQESGETRHQTPSCFCFGWHPQAFAIAFACGEVGEESAESTASGQTKTGQGCQARPGARAFRTRRLRAVEGLVRRRVVEIRTAKAGKRIAPERKASNREARATSKGIMIARLHL